MTRARGWLYGDVMRYPLADDPDTRWLFMYLRPWTGEFSGHEVITISVPHDDDQWEVGTLIYVGDHELEMAE